MNWMDNNYWTTIDRKQLYPKDFTDNHLINTISFIEKRAPIVKFDYEEYLLKMPWPQGEIASLEFERDLIRIEQMSDKEWLKEFCNIYNLLYAEACSRGLINDSVR